MQIIFWIIVFAFAAFGAWAAANRVSDWINADDDADVAPPPLVPYAYSDTTGNSYHVPPLRADYGVTEVKAKRQTRKASPKNPSGKTARKRNTKAGK